MHIEHKSPYHLPDMLYLVINGDPVLIPAGYSVFDALRRKASAHRLGELSASPEAKPLVAIDGVDVQERRH